MDTRDGRIYSEEEMRRKFTSQEIREQFVPIRPTNRRKIGRNELCPCGSGKKFKRCCLKSVEIAKRGTKL